MILLDFHGLGGFDMRYMLSIEYQLCVFLVRFLSMGRIVTSGFHIVSSYLQVPANCHIQVRPCSASMTCTSSVYSVSCIVYCCSTVRLPHSCARFGFRSHFRTYQNLYLKSSLCRTAYVHVFPTNTRELFCWGLSIPTRLFRGRPYWV